EPCVCSERLSQCRRAGRRTRCDRQRRERCQHGECNSRPPAGAETFHASSPEKVEGASSLFLHVQKRKAARLLGRRRRWPVARLQPTGSAATGCDLAHQRVISPTAIERVRTTRMEATRSRRPCRIRHFPGQSLGERAASIRVWNRTDQCFVERM